MFYISSRLHRREILIARSTVYGQHNSIRLNRILVVKNGPSGKPLEFSFKTRDEIATIDELGRVICNICNMVPGGVVIFFPSYAYEKKVYAHFDKTGVLARILKKKQIFREPKKSSEMDKVLKDYARNACKQGAILLSVVGGKMSEGINFR